MVTDRGYPFWLILLAFVLGFFGGMMAVIQAVGTL